jgi:hypothetical protein
MAQFEPSAYLLLGLIATHLVYAESAPLVRATLGSADTVITAEAGPQSASVTSLALRGEAAWTNGSSEALPDSATVNGVVVPLHWHLNRRASRLDARRIELIYVAQQPRLRLAWEWQARAEAGPLEHTIRIQNLGTQSVELPLVPSLRFAFQVDPAVELERFWVEKGGDHPSDAGTHADRMRSGDTWQGTSSTYARPIDGEPPEMIPYVLVHQMDADEPGWYLGIEFSGRTRIALQRQGPVLRGEAGLNPLPGPYRTRIAPNDTLVTPTVFLGAARGGPEGAGNALRRWVRAVLGNPRILGDPAYPFLVSNSWGSGVAVNAELARRMIDDARDLGLELYHLDAGWFRGVGDWHADPSKFPEGIAAIADYAHRAGLKFGLWVDWAQAGISTQPGALNVRNPLTRDWLIADPPPQWSPSEPYKGITVDLGVPAAAHWAARATERLVSDNHLDMLEHDGYLVAQGSSRSDHPAEPPDPGTLRVYEDSGYLWVDGSNSTDVSDHATRAYYAIQAQLRRRHPRLLLEVCNDGGRMVDFGSAAHGDYFSITDHYDPLSNRRAFYDASYVLPPAMLEAYVGQWSAPSLDNLRYMLRSGMMGWFSLMLDTNLWTRAERDAARAEFAFYRTTLRPLIREADLFHVAGRPDGVHWDGIEYFSSAVQRGVLYAFRGSAPDQATHRFLLRGLELQRRYRLVLHDHPDLPGSVETGLELMQRGFEVKLADPLSSEFIVISAVP